MKPFEVEARLNNYPARLLTAAEGSEKTETLAAALKSHEERKDALRHAIAAETGGGGGPVALLEFIEANPADDSGSAVNEILENLNREKFRAASDVIATLEVWICVIVVLTIVY